MKLSLPSTWTSQKINTLLLLTWLSVNGVEAGQAFKNCLANHNDTTSYEVLLDFPFNIDNTIDNSKSLRLCCDSSQCLPMPPVSEENCYYSFPDKRGFECSRIAPLTIFCEPFSRICGGIVGNAPITTNILEGNCVEKNITLNIIINYLATTGACIDSLDKGYAGCDYCVKTFDSYSCDLGCSWDNGGWICRSEYPNNSDLNCTLQLLTPWPGSADKNPLLPTSITTDFSPTVSSTSVKGLTTITSDFLPTNPPYNPRLTEKIAIPIGAVIGTITIGGITYYVIQQRKKKKILLIASSREQEIVNNEPAISEVIASTSYPGKELPSLPVQNLNFQDKSNKLAQLIQQTKNKIASNLEIALETLLDTQSEIVKGNNNYSIRKDQREAKEKLLTKLNLEEINNLLQLQSEAVQLQLQQEQELQTQVEVNPYGQEARNLGREL